jgi:hypothetical protein
MKTNRLLISTAGLKLLPFRIHAFAALLALAPSVVLAQSSNDRVRIEVRPESDQDRKDIKGSSADTVTQNKSLQIAISGKPKSPETRKGKWTIYGRDLKKHGITVLESGEFNLDLPASGQQKIESKKVSTTYTPEHSVVSKSSGRGGSSARTPKAKKVEAEGTKYAGYSIVIKDGDKVVGETADPMGIVNEASK